MPTQFFYLPLYAGKFFMIFCRLLIFKKIKFTKILFLEYHRVSNSLDSNCLQKLSADTTSRQRVNLFHHICHHSLLL